MTSSTAIMSVTIVRVMSLCEATAAGLAAAWAPASMSGAIASGRRAYTVNECPALRRFRAIGVPIAPRPIKPRLVMWICYSLAFVGDIKSGAIRYLSAEPNDRDPIHEYPRQSRRPVADGCPAGDTAAVAGRGQ